MLSPEGRLGFLHSLIEVWLESLFQEAIGILSTSSAVRFAGSHAVLVPPLRGLSICSADGADCDQCSSLLMTVAVLLRSLVLPVGARIRQVRSWNMWLSNGSFRSCAGLGTTVPNMEWSEPVCR